MKIFILVEAGDLITNSLIVSNTKDDLCKVIKELYEKERESFQLPLRREDYVFTERQEKALLKMIENHADWSIGRHELKCEDPLWQPWILFICNDRGGFVEAY